MQQPMGILVLGALITVGADGAAAQSKCDAKKLTQYGKKVLCLAKVEAKAAKTGSAIDLLKQQKCIDKFVEKCAKAEADADCTTAARSCVELAEEAETCRDAAVAPRCEDGDGECPFGCGAGNDSDCPGCFVDLGLTVLDTCTNLEWEKKDTAVGSGGNAGNLHDVDNQYAWAGKCSLDPFAFCQPNGAAEATCTAQAGAVAECSQCLPGKGACSVGGAITTIWDWVNQLNAASFAGHTDWRLATSAGTVAFPTGYPAELELIVDLGAPGCGGGAPCIDPIFGPTVAAPLNGPYWSASRLPGEPPFNGVGWLVFFGDGSLNVGGVDNPLWVRAVRPAS